MGSVLISGATGFVGRHLVRRLSANAVTRIAGTYHRSPPLAAPGGVDWHHVDSIGPSTEWRPMLEKVDVVVHAAAKVHVGSPGRAERAEFYSINAEGTERLVRQAREAGVRRFVLLSSIAVYGCEASALPLTETSTASPRSDYGRSKHLAEQALREASGPMQTVIVRPPMIYGPFAPGNFARLSRLVSRRLPLPLANAVEPRSLLGIDNLTHFLELCLTAPAAAGEVFLVADGEDLSTRELVRLIARAQGHEARLFAFPGPLRRAFTGLPMTRALVAKLFGALQLDTRKARELLAWSAPGRPAELVTRAIQAAENIS